ncbi:hypothetical protein [Carboxylicivirga sp. M1479]|uniref:hypothetical protein n=1 Tax=Carboxylicivirga sp. M1479 TaxID=2594476 RepID=UPI0011785BFF|nr:hypothetical protein [Carboxylicivirga sp. M1479]TRX63980.1 hypothetical protein FNN09_18220 [Carboxylicivirga sp. M1479]
MRIKLFLTLCFICCLQITKAQKYTEAEYGIDHTIDEPSNLFTDDEVLEVSIRFKVRQYTRKKPREYIPALLTTHHSASDSTNHKLKLKSRGEFRNQFCSFPPIKLNFKKGDFSYEDLDELNKVKLVTHCQYSHESEENIYKEYLCYKLFNVLTDNSFGVRMLKINYIDTGKKKTTTIHYGFLIEPVNLLSERQHLIHTEVETISQLHIQQDVLDRVAIFNYMIGNGDWSVANQHNLKVFVPSKPAPQPNGIAVPYDFDYSGMVNTSYALPSEGSNISSVTERYYMGLCRDDEVFKQALQEFLDKKEEFYRVITNFERLDKREQKQMLNYLDSFYEEIEKEKIIKNMKSTCIQ